MRKKHWRPEVPCLEEPFSIILKLAGINTYYKNVQKVFQKSPRFDKETKNGGEMIIIFRDQDYE